jgi:uncharacterized OsmC-like protein
MQGFPHVYVAEANGGAEGSTEVSAKGLPSLACSAPAEFGGPGDQWSPETLLVASVANCFLLSFRAIAGASKLDWISLSCEVEGILDRPDRVTQFVEFKVHAELLIPADVDQDKALRLLDKSEHICLITNSLKAESHLTSNVIIAA